MSVDVITFGCRLNTYESEVIRRQAQAAGVRDTVVFNTCAVTAEAVRQSRQAIRRLKRERPAARIVVTGCAAQTEPTTFADMPEVALVLGNAEKLEPEAWRAHRDALAAAPFGIAAEEKVAVNDIMMVTQTAAHLIDGVEGHARAFVQVQNGCDHRCTFCIIPYGRGNSRSVPMGEVVAQVRTLCARGYREVVLTGVDLTSYGANLPGAPRLGSAGEADPETRAGARAAAALLDRFGGGRSRPARCVRKRRAADAAPASLAAVGRRSHPEAHEAPAPARRRRSPSAEQVRRLRPDVVFGGDIIAGFPTETEAMFARSLDLVEECGLTHLHVFPFSPRPGTPAARMPQLAPDVIKDRARRLRERGEAALRRHLDAQVGAIRKVLSESRAIGHTEHFTPVRLDAAVRPGLILELTVAGHDGRRLLAA